MKDSIILEGKIYISARRAAKIINYAQDYIGQLCRAGKLDSKMVGRSWFVTEESLLSHRENAVDSTQERVLKIIKNNDVVIRETIKTETEKIETAKAEIKSAPIVSPISSVVSPINVSGIKYEADNKSMLPELRKKVPAPFALPKNISKLHLTPFSMPSTRPSITAPVKKSFSSPSSASVISSPGTAVAILSHLSPRVATLLVIGFVVSTFMFTAAISTYNYSQNARNTASVGTVATGFFSRVLGAFGLLPKSSSLATRDTMRGGIAETASSTQTGGFNGIGITPSISTTIDEIEKAKIANSFSDQVTIQPDQSGTAGVIKPVFKKGDGEDFVYVLVPVKEKKQ